jgi:hypothetical protein
MNHEIHEAREKWLEPIILCGNRLHPTGEPAALDNALSFRGFNCSLRQEQIGGHAEMFCQRADVRQRQPLFPAQNIPDKSGLTSPPQRG